jgi:hypothetical protein
VVFVCAELLRGHFQTAQLHLRHGIKILREMGMIPVGKDETLCWRTTCGSVDDWIVEAFSRLHFQTKLFGYPFQGTCLPLKTIETPIWAIHSINEAWQLLDQLLSRTINLTRQAYHRSPQSLNSINEQKRIQNELSQWFDLFEAFQAPLDGKRTADEDKCNQLLCVYHTMAGIMVETSLRANDELEYDRHTDRFILLLMQLANFWKTALKESHVRGLPGHLVDMSHSIIDVGWIPPLYYMATKCRIHRIRLHAIRLLECTGCPNSNMRD